MSEDRIPPTEVDSESRRPGFARTPGRILVEVVGGPMDGETRRTAKGTLTIGRAEDNDLSLAFDPSVSTKHARIQVDESGYWLEDLGSTNGTYLGQAKVDGRVLLAEGALFTVGRTMLELVGA
jgi:pSer/pThr/pTyr-binding forkhead associated (FHA) protein